MARQAPRSDRCDGCDELSGSGFFQNQTRRLFLLQHKGAGYALQVFAYLKQLPNPPVDQLLDCVGLIESNFKHQVTG